MRSLLLLTLAAAALLGLWWFGTGPVNDPGPVLGPGLDPAEVPSPGRPATLSVGEVHAAEGGADVPGEASADGVRSALAAEVHGLPVAGRVLEQDGSGPVPGARVRLQLGDLEVQGETDSEGAFALVWPHASLPAVRVESARHVDQVRPLAALAVGGDPDPEQMAALEFRLLRSGAIAGRADPLARGAAEEGMEVLLWHYGAGRDRGEPLTRTTLDRIYRFRFDDLAPGSYMIGVVDPRTPLTFESGILVEPGLDSEVLLPLERGFALNGRVVRRGALTSPVAGARVRAVPELQGLHDGVERLARADRVTAGDGSFRLEGLPAGLVELVVETPWGSVVREQVSVHSSADEREVVLRVQLPARLAGRVRSPEGAPAGGAWVACTRRDRVRDVDWSDPASLLADDPDLLRARCDGQGRFDLGEVPGDTDLVVVAWPEEGGPTSTSERVTLRQEEARTDLELRLPGTGAVRGRVEDEQGGPLAGAELRVSHLSSIGRVTVAEVRSDEEGRFLVEGLAQGGVEVRASLEGFRPDSKRGLVDGEDLMLVLRAERVVTGHVLDPDGNAVPDAWVRATKHEENGEEANRNWRRSETRTARTDEAGAFVLDDLTEGRWQVRPQARTHMGGVPQDVEMPREEGRHLLFEMEPAPVVEGGTLVGELVVEASGDPVPGLRFENLREGTVRLSGTRFTISGVRPGNLALVAQSEGFERIDFPHVNVEPGSETDLGRWTLRRATQVVVRVLDPEGKPVEGATVRLVPLPVEEGGSPNTQSALGLGYEPRTRRYARGGVARYRWELLVRHKDFKNHRERFVPDLDRHEVTVRLESRR